MSLTLEQATNIVDGAFAKGRQSNFKPMCVAVLDVAGHLIALKRSEKAASIRVEIAISKAAGTLRTGVSSREIAHDAVKHGEMFSALIALERGAFIPQPGGLLVRQDGEVIGAVGVAGAGGADNDELCAAEGIRAAGLEVVLD